MNLRSTNFRVAIVLGLSILLIAILLSFRGSEAPSPPEPKPEPISSQSLEPSDTEIYTRRVVGVAPPPEVTKPDQPVPLDTPPPPPTDVIVEGTVRDVDGLPTKGAKVFCSYLKNTGRAHVAMEHVTRTNKNGEYRFSGIPPETLYFFLRARGHGHISRQAVLPHTGPNIHRVVHHFHLFRPSTVVVTPVAPSDDTVRYRVLVINEFGLIEGQANQQIVEPAKVTGLSPGYKFVLVLSSSGHYFIREVLNLEENESFHLEPILEEAEAVTIAIGPDDQTRNPYILEWQVVDEHMPRLPVDFFHPDAEWIRFEYFSPFQASKYLTQQIKVKPGRIIPLTFLQKAPARLVVIRDYQIIHEQSVFWGTDSIKIGGFAASIPIDVEYYTNGLPGLPPDLELMKLSLTPLELHRENWREFSVTQSWGKGRDPAKPYILRNVNPGHYGLYSTYYSEQKDRHYVAIQSIRLAESGKTKIYARPESAISVSVSASEEFPRPDKKSLFAAYESVLYPWVKGAGESDKNEDAVILAGVLPGPHRIVFSMAGYEIGHRTPYLSDTNNTVIFDDLVAEPLMESEEPPVDPFED